MKNRNSISIAIATIAIFGGLVLCIHRRGGNESLSESERRAMEVLPGYSFVFEGETNHIVNAKTYKKLMSQHRMMPYLELVAERLDARSWYRDCVIRVIETETQVVITVPSWAEHIGMTGPTVFRSDYSLEVTIDKKTMDIISAWQG